MVEGELGARMECGVCWQVYDPAAGDGIWQIPPRTPFAQLPPHWTCPNCAAEQSRFMALTD
jgi:rubredoxin